ncbi:hypothetical protein RJ639_037158 [Escallonia herrerae]|uniref:Integrase catalytic domain-containing protein n=1 Tax=Escallonia herrerae TaxID=1293975 RepID=A0AA89BHW8_9ASTE|nr:hypothetical protein RJ639_037158 [Escallonia herrerae]
MARTTTVAIPTIPAVISPFVATISAPETVVPPAVTITPPSESTVLPPFQTFGTSEPLTTSVIHTTPPVMNNEADLMAAVVNKPPLQSEPRALKTPERTNQHVMHKEDGQSDDERRNPRSQRQEESSYEAHSTKDTYYYPGEHCVERYTSALIIIARPFTEEVDHFPAPPSFKMPLCESYDGTGDPMEHLAHFTSGMNLHLVPDQIMCRAFPIMLKGAAHRKKSSTLFHIVQGPKESLNSYYTHFNTEKLLIDNLDPGVTFAAMARGVKPGTPLRFSLNKRPPKNMSNLLDRVEKYLRAKEDSMTTKDEGTSGQKRRDRPEGRLPEEPKRSWATLSKHLTLLTARQKSKKARGVGPQEPPLPRAGGTSKSARKAYARQVNLTQGPVNHPRIPNTISFDDTDLKKIITLHDDAQVISLPIDAFVIKRILVDTGSSADILFEEAFSQIQISRNQIRPVSLSLYGFTGASTPVEGDERASTNCKVEEALAIEDQRDKHIFRRAEPNIKNFEWTAECQASFEALKNYLSAPNLLSKPLVGEELFSYLAIANSAVSAILVREQDDKQLPIYYVSKVLQGAELRYPDIEKLTFSLLVAARKLRPYFQSHSITALADFIVECTLPIEDEEQLPQKERPFTWTLHVDVDGSSNANGSGAGLILHGPENLQDAISYKKKCGACQRFSSIPRQAPSPLSTLSSPIPFAMWGMDILGPFPPAMAQRKFVIVAIDYFTKWVEVEAMPLITERKCEDFFWRGVVCRFGIPRVLITDNGKQFDNSTFRTFCANLSIEQHFTSVAHPQTNRQTEVTNRTLLQGIKKKLDGANGLWVDELPKILWAYNTTSWTSTGETHFSLSFGTEALILVEIGLPSLRLTMYDPVHNE